MRGRWGVVLCIVLGVARVAAGVQPRDDEGRAEYRQGKDAFERHDFESAYDHFKRAFTISERPELLFDIALTLEELKRPHDAAEALNAYLRQRPNDPDRSGIEDRISVLEEKQRILDADARAKARAAAPASPALTASAPAPAPPRRTALAVGLSVAAGVVLVVAIGVGVGLGTAGPDHTATPLGAWRATR
jgi:tetratricopeptide (TPR) repeat protein